MDITSYSMNNGRSVAFQRGTARIIVNEDDPHHWEVQVKRGGEWVKAKGYVHPELVQHVRDKTGRS